MKLPCPYYNAKSRASTISLSTTNLPQLHRKHLFSMLEIPKQCLLPRGTFTHRISTGCGCRLLMVWLQTEAMRLTWHHVRAFPVNDTSVITDLFYKNLASSASFSHTPQVKGLIHMGLNTLSEGLCITLMRVLVAKNPQSLHLYR